MTESQIEVCEQINEVKAYLYCNENLPVWIKELCNSKLKTLETRKKILMTYNK
jgi:hypothetical protein